MGKETAERTALIDVTSDALTEVWIRFFDQSGKGAGANIELCGDPRSKERCEPMRGHDVGIVGTRRLRIQFPRGIDGTEMKIQLVPNRKQFGWTELLFDTPDASAPVAARNLATHGVAVTFDDSTWVFARTAFTLVPHTYVVYATSEFQLQGSATPVRIGEPLLKNDSLVLRANGESGYLKVPAGVTFDMLVSASRPAEIVMPPPLVDADGGRSDVSMYDYPYGDDTAEFTGFEAPELTAFLKARKPVKACIARELSASGSGFGYDLAQYKKDGTLKKIQSLTSFIEERTYNRCNVGRLDKQRVKLRTTLRARALADVKQAL